MSQSDMSQHDVPLQTASVTDRGLNERRPLNEDSFLSDEGRRIFAVADGVGGAEAGEVASQTAIEVLDEAFRHHRDGEDIEDLMEIAIQRANSSIHQLSREHPKLSMMATTIVALHLDGYRATVGHVGDSRLYRLAPDGQLLRETEDHSMVEEEVRAGRMTPQQAANHPSRNVILRALGAEASVEVDMKVIEFETGTTFLLCTDGITRHIPDEELRQILLQQKSCEAACAEMKRLCFERGAEDNLTAVIIRVGEAATAADDVSAAATGAEWEDERTLVTEDTSSPSPPSGADASAAASISEQSSAASSLLQRPFHDVGRTASFNPARPAQAAAASVVPATTRAHASTGDASHSMAAQTKQSASGEVDAPVAARRSGGAGKTLAFLAALVVVGAIAFLGGIIFQRRTADTSASNAVTPPAATMGAATPTTPAANAVTGYEQRRRQVDRSPATEAARMSAEMQGQPLASDNPEFLYLYGRSLLLSGRPLDALPAFEKAAQRVDQEMTAENAQLKIEARLAAATAALQANNEEAARRAAQALESDIKADSGATTTPPASQQGASPTVGTNSEPNP